MRCSFARIFFYLERYSTLSCYFLPCSSHFVGETEKLWRKANCSTDNGQRLEALKYSPATRKRTHRADEDGVTYFLVHYSAVKHNSVKNGKYAVHKQA
jgi:hypothetical protein